MAQECRPASADFIAQLLARELLWQIRVGNATLIAKVFQIISRTIMRVPVGVESLTSSRSMPGASSPTRHREARWCVIPDAGLSGYPAVSGTNHEQAGGLRGCF